MKPLVAIVDDEENIAKVWAEYLGDDFEIQVSNDPIKFIEEVTKSDRQPDVIVTDLMMPGIRGQDLIETLKSRGVQSRFIIVSAYAQKSDAIRAINSGVLGLIEKPVKPDALKSQIDEVLNSISESGGGDGHNSVLFKLCQLLNHRAELLARRLFKTENLCTTSGVPLFASKVEMREYNDFQRHEEQMIREIIELQRQVNQSDE